MVLDRLAQGRDDPETTRKLLSEAREELDDLASLVDTLLAWAVGVGSLSRDDLDLRRIVEQAVRGCAIEAADSRVRIVAPEGVTVHANGDHLISAISNLVRNALAYSPKESEVIVEAARQNGVARISVRDQGPGVLPDEREAIFDPFRRGRAGRGRRGGGLGLFIARRAVEAHGGVIWAESGRKGATFRVEIPQTSGSQP
jgi:signal transduction histidine kinase